ncbi:MAG TPA: class I fructose-bisphosphate aldolase [Gemmatimonadaceae bacterium]|nr:class I fructose-bisphosphate aldolase [Gemmatimonadaceae bacterium]
MQRPDMTETIIALMAPGKGLLAADESLSSIATRFQPFGIESTEESRREYRDMLFTAPGIGEYISGVILFDETLRQRREDGRPFATVLVDDGIVPGIKVDAGTVPLACAPGERITEGLDGLRERLAEYSSLGARFAKWRAVITIAEGLPSEYCLDTNAHALARYAALCQEASIVPIVEPEVLMEGVHPLERTFEVTEATLIHVFAALRGQRIDLEHLLLKASMVVPGADREMRESVDTVAEATVRCLRRTVPAAVPGVVFLSGGQDPQTATRHLNAMNAMTIPHPWPLSFSYARALQAPALEAWRGKPENVTAGQRAFLHRARCNAAASLGRYAPEMELAEEGETAHAARGS